MQKRWRLKEFDPEKANALHQSLRINKTVCKLLTQRGSFSFEDAREYFRPALTRLHDPFIMKDMRRAVERIAQAIKDSQRVLIYGDYDVDGTSSVASLFRFLSPLIDDLDFYIPHRHKEGYGVSVAGIAYAIEKDVSLIISLDCGIKSVGLVAEAARAGIDFIICDHHLPDIDLPPALAILNPKQADCAYPFKELCGCGVTLKLMQALCTHLNLPDEKWQDALGLAALATAADIVPMTGENRIITYFGLKLINENPPQAFKALLHLSQAHTPVHVNTLVFALAPRINAAGRMDDARKAALMLIEEDYERALEFAKELQLDNTDRKEVDLSITEQALAMLQAEPQNTRRKSTVLFKEDWHKGVVGIVASRLIDHYYRPTIVLTQSGDKVSGSARSVHGFNVYEAIHQCRDLLTNYGGHFYAAGLTLQPQNVDSFAERFEEVVAKTILPEQLIPEILIDAEIEFEEINTKLLGIINQMEPFGPGNMRPVFLSRRVYDTGWSKILKEQHVKFSLKHHKHQMQGIGFNMAEKFKSLRPNDAIDIVFTIDENDWADTKSIQLRIIDFERSEKAAYAK